LSAGVVVETPRYRLRIVAAYAVGLMVGTSGLATAGALPNGAQEVAHRTLAIGPNLVRRNDAAGLTVTSDSCRSLNGGEPYDLGMTIDVLVAAGGHPAADDAVGP